MNNIGTKQVHFNPFVESIYPSVTTTASSVGTSSFTASAPQEDIIEGNEQKEGRQFYTKGNELLTTAQAIADKVLPGKKRFVELNNGDCSERCASSRGERIAATPFIFAPSFTSVDRSVKVNIGNKKQKNVYNFQPKPQSAEQAEEKKEGMSTAERVAAGGAGVAILTAVAYFFGGQLAKFSKNSKTLKDLKANFKEWKQLASKGKNPEAVDQDFSIKTVKEVAQSAINILQRKDKNFKWNLTLLFFAAVGGGLLAAGGIFSLEALIIAGLSITVITGLVALGRFAYNRIHQKDADRADAEAIYRGIKDLAEMPQ